MAAVLICSRPRAWVPFSCRSARPTGGKQHEQTHTRHRGYREQSAYSQCFEVLEAVDGEKGVAMAAECRPDLIDIQLPIVDGYEATRRIKANPELRHIPIIAVTSYALSGDDAKALAAGCDGYFAKPFSPRVILAKVREFLT
jgi:two-component system, cell cycle response regulator DivK